MLPRKSLYACIISRHDASSHKSHTRHPFCTHRIIIPSLGIKPSKYSIASLFNLSTFDLGMSSKHDAYCDEAKLNWRWRTPRTNLLRATLRAATMLAGKDDLGSDRAFGERTALAVVIIMIWWTLLLDEGSLDSCCGFLWAAWRAGRITSRKEKSKTSANNFKNYFARMVKDYWPSFCQDGGVHIRWSFVLNVSKITCV